MRGEAGCVMGCGRVRLLVATVVTALVCGATLTSLARSQPSDDPVELNAEVVRLYQAGKYAEAVDVAKQSLGIREKMLGPEHPAVGLALNNLAALYREQGRYVEAE